MERLAVPLPLRVPRVGSVRLVLEAMRPQQWIKNAFVLAGVVFAGKVLDLRAVGEAMVVTGAFCLASGAAYLVNDARDAETDRHNPRTAGRPVARRALAPERALAAGAWAGAGALALAGLINAWSLLAVAAYLVLQLTYSHALKHVLFVDVLAIAAGFVLRVAAGGAAVSVPISWWLLASTCLLATFLALAKRRAEVVALAGATCPKRRVLERYSVRLLDPALDVVTVATLGLYLAYAAAGAHSRLMLLTVPFVVFGLVRVRQAVHRRPAATEDPALLVRTDRGLLVCISLWAAFATAIAAVAGG